MSTKPTPDSKTPTTLDPNVPTATKPKAKILEEDDEFEDFPAEDWTEADTEVPGGKAHLWEESWDDDDTSEDFSKQLKEELKKSEAAKAGGNEMQR